MSSVRSRRRSRTSSAWFRAVQVILDQFRLDGRVAIVTGAGKGIGAGCARALAEAGADVVCAARTQADIDEIASQVNAIGRRAIAVATDVTAKAALSRMTRARAPELPPKIRVNAIEVGGIETDALAHVLSDDAVRAQLEGNTPMQRVGLPTDIAAAVVYLASPASSFVTGKIFEVDGGVEAPAFTIPFERL